MQHHDLRSCSITLGFILHSAVTRKSVESDFYKALSREQTIHRLIVVHAESVICLETVNGIGIAFPIYKLVEYNDHIKEKKLSVKP